ncbi:MAG TPA: SGNH/GDSL hydrolase family protein [Candidatus Binatia bacterium]|nr:SGNH/GDSL hydrolase family protein [Candidatus Binatia bacterium]
MSEPSRNSELARPGCPRCGYVLTAPAVTCPSCKASLLSVRKRIAFASVIAFGVLVTVELALRLYFGALMGPSVFFYGTSFHRMSIGEPTERSPLMRTLHQWRLRGSGDEFHNVRQHENHAGNYTKYFPNEKRYTYDVDTGEVYTVTINSRGLRGNDPAPQKAPGTVRVVTLGASSTFGYHDPDDGTYPAILERILNERCADGPRFEVINLGIPHLTSAEIVSLFLAEAVPLQPDIVTFYEGINDSAVDGEGGTAAPKPKGPWKLFKRWAREHFVLPFLMHEIDTMQSEVFDAAQVEAAAQGRPEKFVANLARLHQACRERGIQFILAKQQARSLLVPREDIRGVTYAEEIARVRDKLAREGSVSKLELNFLIHEPVITAGERWARENGVPVVDVVEALDRDRDTLVSWVHLNPRGNAIIADAYARTILAGACPAASRT